MQGTTLAVPVVGTWLTWALFGGEFPGRIIEHLYLVHLLASAVIIGLVVLRLRAAWRLGPVQLPGPGRTADRVVGLPFWPQAAVRVGGLLSATLGVITLLAGTLTISPVWRYGPSSPGNAYAGSQPDWYTAFLDGALRLVPPGWEVIIAGPDLDARRPDPAGRHRALRRTAAVLAVPGGAADRGPGRPPAARTAPRQPR